jgi:uncharacterized cupin superfamily protein
MSRVTAPCYGAARLTSSKEARMAGEARLAESSSGLYPAGEGWFVVNVRDARWTTHPTFGAACVFEGPEAWFRQLGIRIKVLEPGQPNCLYHRESLQEDFLVLSGSCRLLVEGEERELRAWDLVHCPPETDHVFVGAGDGPCVILMVGARSTEERLLYPVSDLAAGYGASVLAETPSPEEAYAPYPEGDAGRPASWSQLPWGQTAP